MMLNTQQLAKLIDLDDERKNLEDRIADIKVERAELEKELLSQFEETGVSSMKVNGKTAYLKRELWTSPIDKPVAMEFLKLHGLESYVTETCNAHSISAYVRELDKSGEPLPDGFLDAFKVSETFKIQTRR